MLVSVPPAGASEHGSREMLQRFKTAPLSGWHTAGACSLLAHSRKNLPTGRAASTASFCRASLASRTGRLCGALRGIANKDESIQQDLEAFLTNLAIEDTAEICNLFC